MRPRLLTLAVLAVPVLAHADEGPVADGPPPDETIDVTSICDKKNAYRDASGSCTCGPMLDCGTYCESNSIVIYCDMSGGPISTTPPGPPDPPGGGGGPDPGCSTAACEDKARADYNACVDSKRAAAASACSIGGYGNGVSPTCGEDVATATCSYTPAGVACLATDGPVTILSGNPFCDLFDKCIESSMFNDCIDTRVYGTSDLCPGVTVGSTTGGTVTGGSGGLGGGLSSTTTETISNPGASTPIPEGALIGECESDLKSDTAACHPAKPKPGCKGK
jgi:hypothetical protein